MPYSDTPRPTLVHHLTKGAFFAVLLATGLGSLTATAAPTKEPPLPEFSVVLQAVQTYFQTLPDYQSGDLLSQKHVIGVLDQVEQSGWTVPERGEMIDRALADGAFLVRELSTKKGRGFMRKLGGQKGSYVRLDHLTQIPQGEQLVHDLVHDKGGEDFIKYLSNTRSGHNLGSMLGNSKHGVNLNKPTDRIFIEADLINALAEIHEALLEDDQ